MCPVGRFVSPQVDIRSGRSWNKISALGLTNRHNKPLTAPSFGNILKNARSISVMVPGELFVVTNPPDVDWMLV